MEQYLTTQEVADLVKCSPRTIADRISSGVYRVGVHFFRPRGTHRILFKRSAIERWIEGEETDARGASEASLAHNQVRVGSTPASAPKIDPIPLLRGVLGGR